MRYRRRGWNGLAADPVADVEYALARIATRRPGIPVVLVGHSMGGRAAIRAAGNPHVRGVVALAPWIPSDDPIDQLAGRDIVVIHGTDDRRTSPAGSARFAGAATPVARSVRYEEIPGGDHAMLRHARTWHRLTADAVVAMAERPDPAQ
jgi:alpha-beta hydrolase superfamily lysophospholipase